MGSYITTIIMGAVILYLMFKAGKAVLDYIIRELKK